MSRVRRPHPTRDPFKTLARGVRGSGHRDPAAGARHRGRATAPVKRGSYKGALKGVRSSIKVSFIVSENGKTVRRLKTSNLPVYCSSGGPPLSITFKNAMSGTFKSTGKQIISAGPRKGQVGATLSITGKFQSRRKESGRVRTVFRNAPSCSGSDGYSTKA